MKRPWTIASLTTASVIAITCGLHAVVAPAVAQASRDAPNQASRDAPNQASRDASNQASRDASNQASRDAPSRPGSTATTTAGPVAGMNLRGGPDFAALVEREGAAVVNISTTARQAAAARDESSTAPADPLPDFFRRFAPRGGIPGLGPENQPRRGVGSGFIVSSDGHILTNAHVVDGAGEVVVRLTDKREFKARVLGIDKRTDVALVKIDAQDLPVVSIGNPERLRVGEWVAAIGSPFGFDNSVTAGIVSAKSRNLPSDSYVPFIQTDVAINPGNSGGPLFNLAGEVVGINSQIYSRSGGYMGVSFAIPIDVAMKVKDDLQKFGRVSRGRLGVTIQPVTIELAESFGLDKPRGALVNTVEPNGAGARAGIRAGDIVIAVNGKTVETASDLPRMIGETRPGETVTVRLQREGRPTDLAVRVGDTPTDPVASAGQSGRDEREATVTGRLGLAVRPATSAEKARLADGGVIVERVTGAAARAGLQPGDAILAINSQPVADPDQLREIAQRAGGRIALLVDRQGTRIYLPIRTG